jgi:hypothetical protein
MQWRDISRPAPASAPPNPWSNGQDLYRGHYGMERMYCFDVGGQQQCSFGDHLPRGCHNLCRINWKDNDLEVAKALRRALKEQEDHEAREARVIAARPELRNHRGLAAAVSEQAVADHLATIALQQHRSKAEAALEAHDDLRQQIAQLTAGKRAAEATAAQATATLSKLQKDLSGPDIARSFVLAYRLMRKVIKAKGSNKFLAEDELHSQVRKDFKETR